MTVTASPAMVDVAQVAPWFLFAADALRNTDPAHLTQWLDDLKACPAPAGVPEVGAWVQALAGADATALEVEYVRLFLHPAGAACPPWQSVHSEEPSLMGESHRQALGWYRRMSLAPPSESEPADHAGLLLAFYALLLDSGDEGDIQEFAASHLAWMAGFGSKLQDQARHPFYRLLGVLIGQLGTMATVGPFA